ncbi:MAG: M67 family metallopeptidase [Bacteroidota bacterium]
MTLKVSEEAQQVMQQDAEATYPNECCGFFYGQESNERTVTEAIPVQNSKEGDQRRRFEISPLDYMKAERYAAENGLSLLGVYHSHPDHPARPSEHDLKQAVPYFSYIIYSIREGKMADVTSWRLDEQGKEFEEEKIAGS